MQRMFKLSGWNKGNRRVANDSMRYFIQSIDMDGEMISSNSPNSLKLFSCPKCEVPLTSSDYAQLG